MIYLLLTLLSILLILVIWSFIRDRRRMRRRTIESIGDELWREIDEERQDSLERGKKFRKALSNALKNSYQRK